MQGITNCKAFFLQYIRFMPRRVETKDLKIFHLAMYDTILIFSQKVQLMLLLYSQSWCMVSYLFWRTCANYSHGTKCLKYSHGPHGTRFFENTIEHACYYFKDKIVLGPFTFIFFFWIKLLYFIWLKLGLYIRLSSLILYY